MTVLAALLGVAVHFLLALPDLVDDNADGLRHLPLRVALRIGAPRLLWITIVVTVFLAASLVWRGRRSGCASRPAEQGVADSPPRTIRLSPAHPSTTKACDPWTVGSRAATRLALSIGALVLAVPGVSACGFNYATDRENTIVNGTNDQDGTVDVLNAVIVSSEDGSGTFIASLSNNSPDEAISFDSLSFGSNSTIEVAAVRPRRGRRPRPGQPRRRRRASRCPASSWPATSSS